MDRLDTALTDLISDFERAEHLIRLITQFRDFGASSVPAPNEDEKPLWQEASDLWTASQNRRTDLPVLSGSLLLYLAGRFEYYVRTIVEIAAEDIASQCREFGDLPPRLKKELINRTAEVVQNPRRYGYDNFQIEGFIVTLADGLKASTSIASINSGCLSSTDANLRPEVLADLLKRIGMDNVWQDVGKQAKTKLHLRITVDADATAEAKSRLNSIMEDRNRIAHPTNTTTFLGPDKVLEATRFLKMLSEVLVDILRVYVIGFSNGMNSVQP